jgi:hypothetical protein
LPSSPRNWNACGAAAARWPEAGETKQSIEGIDEQNLTHQEQARQTEAEAQRRAEAERRLAELTSKLERWRRNIPSPE